MWFEKFKNVMQQTEKEALNNCWAMLHQAYCNTWSNGIVRKPNLCNYMGNYITHKENYEINIFVLSFIYKKHIL